MIPAMVQAFTGLKVTRFVWFSFLYFAIVGAIPEVAHAQSPRFEGYCVTEWRGRVAPLNLQSHPLARKYRTLIRQQMRDEGVNFAGRYTSASMGCGRGCSITARPSGVYYYEWKNRRLRLVKFTPVASYPDPDPPVEHQPHRKRHTIPIAQHKAR